MVNCYNRFLKFNLVHVGRYLASTKQFQGLSMVDQRPKDGDEGRWPTPSEEYGITPL
jgi:hypothetical protein